MNNLSHLERVFSAQGDALPRLRATTAEQRIDKLRRLREVIEAHFDEAMSALYEDLGKPPFEAVFDIGATFVEIGLVSENLEQWMIPTGVSPGAHAATGAEAKIVYQPRGRVLIFSPWNFPFSLLFQPLVGAIAAGNAAILKPSELAPATARVAAAIVAAAFEDDEVALVQGGPDVAEALLDLPVEHIFFTGSTEVGKRVMTAAARHLTTVTLELGGKCPAIVDRDADLEKAVDRIAWGKFLNAGQICLAPDHIWVHADRRDAFVASMLDRIKTSYYGDGMFSQRDSAHVLNDRHVGRIRSLVEESISMGARRVAGGSEQGLYMEPTVLVDVLPDSPIMAEEIFGPVLPILVFDDTDALVVQLRRQSKPLALYIFSEDHHFVEKIIGSTTSGGVTVNDVLQHAAESNLPFGGVGSSGMGAYHGYFSFREMSHARSIYYQASDNPMEPFFHPPYGDRLPM